MKLVFNILRWVIAILSVAGTLALLTWLVVIFFKKDHKNDAAGNRH